MVLRNTIEVGCLQSMLQLKVLGAFNHAPFGRRLEPYWVRAHGPLVIEHEQLVVVEIRRKCYKRVTNTPTRVST